MCERGGREEGNNDSGKEGKREGRNEGGREGKREEEDAVGVREREMGRGKESNDGDT